MSVVKLLQEGLDNSDWGKIKEAYENLAGKSYEGEIGGDDEPDPDRDKEIDRILTAGLQPRQRRAPIKFISVQCSDCGKKEEVDPALAGVSYDKTSGRSLYKCNNCIVGK